MARLGTFGVTILAMALLAGNVLAQRGGTVGGDMHRARSGVMIRGSGSAATGARTGVVTKSRRLGSPKSSFDEIEQR